MSRVFNSKAEDSTDLYGTPDDAIELLLPYLPKQAKIWEPCRGYGAIESFLTRAGFSVVASDLSDGRDALSWQPDSWDMVVTNPPWSLKTEFLERFYILGKPFAFLLPGDLVNGKRTAMFDAFGIQLIVPNWRVRYNRFDGEKPVPANSPNTGSMWFCHQLNLPKDLLFVVK